MADHARVAQRWSKPQTGMCNLYRMNRSVAEIAHVFGLVAPLGLNLASEVYPKGNGLVIAEGTLRSMTWGFPLALKSKRTVI